LIRRLISLIRNLSRRFTARSGLPAGLTALLLLLIAVFLFLGACRLIPQTQTTTTGGTVTSADSSGSTASWPGTSGTTSQAYSTGSSSSSLTGASSDATSTETGSLITSELTSGSSGLPSPTASSGTTDSSQTATSPGTTTTRQPTGSPTVQPSTKPTATPTLRPTATPTLRPTATPTLRPTATPTLRPTATPTSPPATATPSPTASASSFPYRNYGTFYRDNYGQNSQVTTSPDGGIAIDSGSAPYGVALLKVSSIPSDKRCKAIVTANGKSYQYEIIKRGIWLGLPMQLGGGSYTITVYEQVSGTSFTPRFAHTFSVNLASSLKPYTAASIMCDFSLASGCVVKGKSLGSGIDTATGRVDAVYRWIVANIDYDRVLANSISSGQVSIYLPDPERTYSTRKGICFDYASLMCAMLRCQGIPTRLVVGQTPLGYHAWNEVYFAGTGWVIVASFSWEYVEGSGWVMFDTTFAAGGMTPESIQDIDHTKQKTY
jgi:hypothetical protein